MLVTDHQLYYRHGWDGGCKPLTPARDRLAAEGLSFDRAYAITPLCAPARRSLLCGYHPHTHRNVHNQNQKPFQETTYLEYLESAGYEQYFFGKWHAGPGDASDHGAQGLSLPGYGNPYTSKEYTTYCHDLGIETATHTIYKKFWNSDTSHHFPELFEGNTSYRCNGTWCGETAFGITNTDTRSHECGFLSYLAQKTLRKLVEQDSKPFHLRVDFWGPHQPYFPTSDYLDLYDPSQIKEYGSFRDKLENKPAIYRNMNQPIADDQGSLIIPSIFDWQIWQQLLRIAYAQTTMVDDAIGAILGTLEESGLSENTLVILTADHGDALASHGGMFDKGSFMTEETVRIPLVVRFPGKVDKGIRTDRLVDTLDIVPTILEAAGISEHKELPGTSLFEEAPRESILLEHHGQGFRDTKRSRTVVTNQYKYTRNEDDIEELYDLSSDPYELNNLGLDSAHTNIVKELAECMEYHLRVTNDPDRKIFFPNRS
jgi:arylsulfatase A-like enzyme